jgi:hypothetical protein
MGIEGRFLFPIKLTTLALILIGDITTVWGRLTQKTWKFAQSSFYEPSASICGMSV